MELNSKNCNEIFEIVKSHTLAELMQATLDYNKCNYEQNLDKLQLLDKYPIFSVPDYFGNKLFDKIDDLKSNIQKYEEAYALFNDEKSKHIFKQLLISKLTGNNVPDSESYCGKYQYFLADLFSYGENEVFVDVGAYDGATSIDFIANCPMFKSIYLYEPTPSLIEKIKENYNDSIDNSNICLKPYAVSDKAKEVCFEEGEHKGGNRVTEEGNFSVKCVSLDEDIAEKITFIKMDIEGSEKDALIGATKHISNDVPKLAICIYHLVDDLWKIPLLINDISNQYTFYIRQHIWSSWGETVLYCVPKVSNGNTNKIDENHIKSRYSLVCKNLNNEKQELFKCLAELEIARGWLDTQYNNYISLAEEQKLYIQQLIEGKEWLEGQYNNYKKLYEEAINTNEETME